MALEGVNLADLRFTLCIEYPNRVMLQTGDMTKRVKYIDAPGVKLIAADTGAVLALDFDSAAVDVSGVKYWLPLYPSVNVHALSSPSRNLYILRDDRDVLASIHAQAFAHHTNRRYTLEFTAQGEYGPRWNGIRCGAVVHQLTANGRTTVVNTPITRIDYSAIDNTTRVTTDYAERRWRI
jgi:hypothetical protein